MEEKKNLLTYAGLKKLEEELGSKLFTAGVQGIVLTREKIMERVWDTEFEGESRTVDMHIKTLRKKLGDSSRHIKTVRNVGYVME